MKLRNPFSVQAKIERAIAEAERARQPRRIGVSAGFLAKGTLFSVLVAAGVVALASRYSVAIAVQENLCLPPYRVWIIDKYETEPARGAIFAFKSRGLGPLFEDGTTIVKVLDGLPGDRVAVTEESTRINDQVIATGLQVARQYGFDPQRYVRQGVIEPDRYWFFGRTADSFDSRYWGSVASHQIIGRAYPLW